MFKYPVQPLTRSELQKANTPTAFRAGATESIPDQLWDTNTYVSAASTRLTFFNATRANRQLSNLEIAGTLPVPKYFQVFGIFLDIFTVPAATAWQDKQLLVEGGAAAAGAPTLTLTMANKEYGPWVLSSMHTTGGIVGFGTATNLNYANNGTPGDSFWADGALLIPPQESFSVVLEWSAAVTLNAGNTQLRVLFEGTMHRKIV